MSEKPVMGFAWYDAATFEQFREAMPDMSDSYEDWREGAHRDVHRAEGQGYRVIRIAMRPTEFFGWCREHGIALPGLQARRQFAADRARLVVRGERAGRRSFFPF